MTSTVKFGLKETVLKMFVLPDVKDEAETTKISKLSNNFLTYK